MSIATPPSPPESPHPLGRRPIRIFISAAEPSGDQHAAELIERIRDANPSAIFFGVAGPLMKAAACEAIDDLTDRSAMLLGALGLAGHAWKLLGRIEAMVRVQPPDLAILVDSPTLHLPMAKRLKRAGIRVMYYVAPQLWAWAPWRIGRVRARVDALAALLPFEEKYFRDRGVPATFVGHPLAHQLQQRTIDQSEVQRLKSLGTPLVACLPGSRHHVIEEVLPGQIEVAQAIARQHPRAAFAFAAASERAASQIKPLVMQSGLRAEVKTGGNGEILTAADLALCASGTATLEVVFYRVPMIVMYNGSKWGYRLVGRFLIQTPHLSLPNILAGRQIVPEFMPYYSSTDPIATQALDLLANPARREQMKADLSVVIDRLGTANAAQGAARIALELASRP